LDVETRASGEPDRVVSTRRPPAASRVEATIGPLSATV
jgi:hypothetical protein